MRSRLAGASQMNIIVPALIGRVEQTGLPVSTHDALYHKLDTQPARHIKDPCERRALPGCARCAGSHT